MIYFNGDSFVAGVELADDVLPEYPGTLDYPKGGNTTMHDNAKMWIAKTYDEKHPWSKVRNDNMKEQMRVEYDRAFPNKIKQALQNVSVINHALGGASMDRIVRTTISDLIELKKTHRKIIAVIGATFPSRTEVPKDLDSTPSHDVFGNKMPWRCVSLTYSLPHQSDDLYKLMKYKATHEKDYHGFVNFFKNVVMLQDFCKVNDIKLYWIACGNNIVTESSALEPGYGNFADLANLMEYADLKFTIDMKQIAIDTHHDVMCPSGHFSEIVHHQTAQLLIPILQGELNVYMD